MHTLVVLSVVLAVATARPQQVVSVSQNTNGAYDLQYAIDGISRSEHRDVLGNVVGGFSHIDPHGNLRRTDFTSGVHGYHAAGPDVPVPVIDTPEVALAKAQHLSILSAESSRPLIPEFQDPFLHRFGVLDVPLVRTVATVPVTQPLLHVGIPETPEVASARAAHLAIHAATRARHLL